MPSDLMPHSECPRCGIIYAKHENRTEKESHFSPKREQTSEKSNLPMFLLLGTIILIFCFVPVYFFLINKPAGDESQPNLTKDIQVTLLSTTRCGYCKLAKNYLEKHSIDYIEWDVEQSEEGRNFYNELNGRGVPIILIGDTRINGYDEEMLKQALQKENLL
jgi:glutaredoxin